jgi:hypothetical protein
MNVKELETKWTFWNVSGKWFGRRNTGQEVKAGTYISVLRFAQHYEDFPW